MTNHANDAARAIRHAATPWQARAANYLAARIAKAQGIEARRPLVKHADRFNVWVREEDCA